MVNVLGNDGSRLNTASHRLTAGLPRTIWEIVQGMPPALLSAALTPAVIIILQLSKNKEQEAANSVSIKTQADSTWLTLCGWA